MAAILPKMKNNFYSLIILSLLTVLVWNCTKDSTVSSDSLYIPKTSDITANATLQELQQGRELYISYCNSCHGLYLPEKYTPTKWKSTMTSMGPKTGLSSSDLLLITKYLCKGMQ
jgi:hypothetical protein